ncbi:hypothetical protein BaOVIS_003540 [Babesia ovis]|uniref:Uncharacterized protein n=1 Tax=Babesia ovis TaxID=5869 RepID=A0A9W5WTJ5_BABOV|nr:hypothetical protein BaOVIS_003540 [Babesia ovis]
MYIFESLSSGLCISSTGISILELLLADELRFEKLMVIVDSEDTLLDPSRSLDPLLKSDEKLESTSEERLVSPSSNLSFEEGEMTLVNVRESKVSSWLSLLLIF